MTAHAYYRHPTIHGNTIVFVCEDDLWSVEAQGGAARRLTTFGGESALPRFSPDGSTIAFIGRDEGHPEVYVMPAQGGAARRLTFLGSEFCQLSGWSADGSLLNFVSDAHSAFTRIMEPFTVPAQGGAPVRLQLGDAVAFDIATHGGVVIGRNSSDPARWKRYRGGTAGDLWVDPNGSGTFRRLISVPGNAVWPMWLGERVFFLSDHEGIGNIYSCTPAGDDLQKHTDEREYYARYPSTDGTRIVYHAGGDIVLLDPRAASVRRVPIEAASSAPQLVRRFVSAGDELESFSPSPDGTALALVARGAAFTMPLWEEAATHYGAGSAVRYRQVEWVDAERIAYVDDAAGFERIAIERVDRSEPPRYFTESDIGRITELRVTPGGGTIAVANHRHELLLVDESTGVRIVDRAPAGIIDGLAFSGDGRFVAYSYALAYDTRIIRVVDVATGTPHDVTSPLRVDRDPAWDPEGKYLYFIGTRDFHPVYDALQFDLSFPQATRPFAVALRKDVPSPFIAKPAPLHKDAKKDEDDDEKPDEAARVDIDFDGISGRVLGFPVEEGNFGQLVAARDRVLYTQFPVKGIKPGGRSTDEESDSGTLHAYGFEEQRSAVLAHDVGDIRLGADHRTLIYSSQEKMRAIDAASDLPEEGDDGKAEGPPSRRSGWLDLSRASVEIEPRAEWMQMYQEAWRMQREQFWDSSMSAVDWDRVRERYAVLVGRLRTRAELSDLIWEMQGELGTSHAYEYGGDYRVPPQYLRGFLGADYRWDEERKGYRIERILRGDSWNRENDSPLAEPGLDVREGDAIVAVGGKPVSPATPLDALLVNLADKDTSLTLERNGDVRRVLVHTLRSERMLRYRAWVEARRAYVHDRTGGTIGYLHIPDMGPWGFSEFHRGFLSEFNREGLIVDVRFNRGGHVSPLLLEKLARRRVGYDIARWGPPQPYPPESLGGPAVALTNQFAGSDGDIFSHCFKLYKLGPLVGKRTWGGVIGINPYHRLVDGTLTTQPEFSFWFVDVGWQVENYGTDPDHDVDMAPHDVRAGSDPQMDKALQLVLELKSGAPATPQFTNRPNLKLPT